MKINSLELSNFRNYETLELPLSPGVNILFGDNAQGKTNILEAVYLCATTKSHRGTKDAEMLRFGCSEGHIRVNMEKEGISSRIDLHLRAGNSKGIAIDGVKLKKAGELMGKLRIVLFSPEDLSIIKDSPSTRRRFMDVELCQIDPFYLYNLAGYNRLINQRNRLLKGIDHDPDMFSTLDIWDEQLFSYGSKLIERRQGFITQLMEITSGIHSGLTGGKEVIKLEYEPNITVDKYREAMKKGRERDIRLRQTTVGPHRDDFSYQANGIDLRRYGSQGQQRTAALSLKLSEIELVKKLTEDSPVLLLDDVLSELDESRQNRLLDIMGGIQTLVTCTGLDDFVGGRMKIDQAYRVRAGEVFPEKPEMTNQVFGKERSNG